MNLDRYTIAETEDFILYDKLATVSVVRDKTGGKSVQYLLEEKFKRPIHPITRLDKVVSGVCLFAKSKEAAAALSVLLSKRAIEKTYIAVVEGQVSKKEATLTHYIRKQGGKARVYDEEHSNTKKAICSYKTIKQLDNYAILEITLITGRFHQLRAQLAQIGNPVKGDVKYGARRKNRDRSIHLHSWKMSFEDNTYVSSPPDSDALWELACEAV